MDRQRPLIQCDDDELSAPFNRFDASAQQALGELGAAPRRDELRGELTLQNPPTGKMGGYGANYGFDFEVPAFKERR
jgi:hypothetical protein